MSPLLGRTGIVDDPGLDASLAFNRRQDHLTYLAQHFLIRPGAAADEMQQRLMLGARSGDVVATIGSTLLRPPQTIRPTR